MKNSPSAMLAAGALVCAMTTATVIATEYHVALTGDDAGDGSAAKPYRSIQAAARVAMPGDTVTVHAGTYRERVDPPRGGDSDAKRIVYQAAPGERVVISGSEPAKGWVRVAGDTWKLTVPNRRFGAFNPYADEIRGDWFAPKGRVHHTGCVYLDGVWLTEARDLDEVLKPVGRTPLWFATVGGVQNGFLVNVAWFKPAGGARVPAGAPTFRYGGKSAACSEGGECAGFNADGTWLRFAEVEFGDTSATVEFRTAALAHDCLIELRAEQPAGELLGVCKAFRTGDWQRWQTHTAEIKPTRGIRSVCLVFKSPGADAGVTTLHAQFPGGLDPNGAAVEFNQRQTVFYPSRNHINYLTVRGFVLEHAATNWAPPSAEQMGVIGTNWSKGWVIEDNVIRHSKCSGIALGKYGDGYDNTNDAGAADPYTACVRRALAQGWNQATIGGHVVRRNKISHCEQTGIVGSMGSAFCTVSENEIHDIHVRALFSGAEMAGIKFHGAVDTVIRDNHIHHANRGIWLDWMCQGAQVTGNLLHDNGPSEDLFLEMQHGPLLVANNLFLSTGRSLWLNSKGCAFVHNLFAAKLDLTPYDARKTPYHPPHATAIAGLSDAPGGDHRFLNNLLVGTANLTAIDTAKLPCRSEGNVFASGARPPQAEPGALAVPDFDPGLRLTSRPDGWYLSLTTKAAWREQAKRQPVTTAMLGKAKVPGLPYENPDGTPLAIDTDYLGARRDPAKPFPGPFESASDGAAEIRVWPKPAARDR